MSHCFRILFVSPALLLAFSFTSVKADDWPTDNKALFEGVVTALQGVDAILGIYKNGTDIMDRPVTAESKQVVEKQLLELAREQGVHRTEILKLAVKVKDCVTFTDLQAEMYNLLTPIDAKFAEVNKKVYRLEVEQAFQKAKYESERKEILKDITSIKKDYGQLRAEVKAVKIDVAKLQFENRMQDYALADLRADVDEIKRWSPDQQSERLGLIGMDFFWKGKHKDAIHHFMYAHAYSTEDPGPLYAMAMAYREIGEMDKAEQMVAHGVAANRLKYPQAWFSNQMIK